VGATGCEARTSLLVLHHCVVAAMCDEECSGHDARSLLDHLVLLPARTRLICRLEARRVPQKSFERLPTGSRVSPTRIALPPRTGVQHYNSLSNLVLFYRKTFPILNSVG
jgi:hypothetical protein